MEQINRCTTPPLETNGISATTPSTGGSMYGFFANLDIDDSPLNPNLLANRIFNTDPMSATLEIVNIVQNTLSPSNSEESVANFSVTIEPFLSCILETTSDDNLSLSDTEEEYKTTEEDFDPASKRRYSDSTPETDGDRESPVKKGRIHPPMTITESDLDNKELPPSKRTKRSSSHTWV